MTGKPLLALDNSILNRLAKDADPEPIIAAILAGYSVRLPEMSFEEALAAREPAIRNKLLGICRRLLNAGYCILPAHWLLDLHIKAFHSDPVSYDWHNVNARAAAIEAEIQRGDYPQDEAFIEQQASVLSRLQKEFEVAFTESASANRPNSFHEWLCRSQAQGGSFWNTARSLFEHAFGKHSAIDPSATLINPPDEAILRTFLAACPPVRAMVYAFELTHYDRSLRLENRPAYKAGRNDQMMAVYLPYCDQFLTDDRPQHKCLVEVASCAGIPVQVRHYNEFCSSFLLSLTRQ
jgi:hypothetical protein